MMRMVGSGIVFQKLERLVYKSIRTLMETGSSALKTELQLLYFRQKKHSKTSEKAVLIEKRLVSV